MRKYKVKRKSGFVPSFLTRFFWEGRYLGRACRFLAKCGWFDTEMHVLPFQWGWGPKTADEYKT